VKRDVDNSEEITVMRKIMFLLSVMVLWTASLLWAGNVSAQDFQRDLEGTVGKARVQVELTRIGQDLTGSYYYEKYGTPIKLKGKLTKSRVTLTEEKGATFEGEFGKDGSFQGQWTSRDKKKSLPVVLKVCLDTVAFTVHSKEWTREGKSESMESCEFGRHYLHPAGYGNSKNLDKIRAAVWKFFFRDADVAAAKGNPQKAIDLESKQFRADCLEAEKEGTVESGHMETTRNMRAVFNEKGILTLEIESWSYTGGIHGDANKNFAVIDLEKGALLPLKDIFKDGYESYLGKIVAKKLVEDAYDQTKAKDLKGAGYPKFKEGSLNDPEFYVTGDGIGFVYNVYALGNTNQPDILVPFKEIEKGLFRPESPVYKLAFGGK
jgi:hypothetical protein